jgi:hypothetical protein
LVGPNRCSIKARFACQLARWTGTSQNQPALDLIEHLFLGAAVGDVKSFEFAQ